MRCRIKVVVPQYSIVGGGRKINKKNNKNGQENLQRSRQKHLENLTFLKNVFHTPLKNSNQDISLSTPYAKYPRITQDMLADVLTKEMRIPQALEDVILKNEISLSQSLENEVKAVGTKIRMVNICNR